MNKFSIIPEGMTLVDALRKLFAKDGYEEVMYPIIKTYFLYSIGELKEVDEFSFDDLRRAYEILEEGIDAKNN